MFSDLSMEKDLAMYQFELGASVFSNRGDAIYSSILRASKMIIHGPTRCQVLILLNAPTTEVIMANTGSVVEFCNRGLVKSVYKA